MGLTEEQKAKLARVGMDSNLANISKLESDLPDVDWSFIREEEGTVTQGPRAGYWPGGPTSGITVGLGIDLAGKTKGELKELKTLAPGLLDKLSPYMAPGPNQFGPKGNQLTASGSSTGQSMIYDFTKEGRKGMISSIKVEMEKAIKKENYLNEDERILINKFIKKIKDELKSAE